MGNNIIEILKSVLMCSGITAFFLYVIFSFGFTSFDVTSWTEQGRIVFAIINSVFFVIHLIIIAIDKDF